MRQLQLIVKREERDFQFGQKIKYFNVSLVYREDKMSEEKMGIEGTGRQSIVADKEFSLPETPKGLLRLDLACGQSKQKGFVGVDRKDFYEKYPGEFLKANLNERPWPFTDGSVYEIYCSHYIEHVADLQTFMEECYRILCPMGTITAVGPYYTSIRAWQDFTHVRALTDITMRYFDQTWLKGNGLDHYGVKADFEPINTVFHFNPEWEPRAEEAKLWALKHYNNVCDDIKYVLRAIKPMRS